MMNDSPTGIGAVRPRHLGLFELSLHLLFVSTAVSLSSSRIVFRISEVVNTVGAITLIVGALWGCRQRWAGVRLPASVRTACWITPLAVVVLLVAVFYHSSVWWRKPSPFLPYAWFIVALAGVSEGEWTRIVRVFRVHALIGTVILVGVLWRGYSWSYVDRSEFIGEAYGMEGIRSPLIGVVYLLYPYQVLLILLPQEKRFWQLVAIAVTAGMTAWAMLGQFRSFLFLGVGMTVLFAIFCWYRAKTIQWSRKTSSLAIVFGLVLVGGLYVNYSSSTRAQALKTAARQTIDRLVGVEAGTAKPWEDVRFADAREYLRELTVYRLVMGDYGMWLSSTDIVMHVGYLKCIICGGLPTLLLICILVYWQGWRAVVTSRTLSVLAAGSVAAMHSLQAIPFGVLQSFPGSAMLFLCAGYCWYSLATSRTRPCFSAWRVR